MAAPPRPGSGLKALVWSHLVLCVAVLGFGIWTKTMVLSGRERLPEVRSQVRIAMERHQDGDLRGRVEGLLEMVEGLTKIVDAQCTILIFLASVGGILEVLALLRWRGWDPLLLGQGPPARNTTDGGRESA